jgi:RiboL-PSP-HEPN
VGEAMMSSNAACGLRKPRPHGGVLARLQAVDDRPLVLSAVTSDRQQKHYSPGDSMSRSSITFDSSIEDASTLLTHFDALHKQQPEKSEVLKRAGLVMALTAWETYVEDRVQEAVQLRLKAVNGSPIGDFVSAKLADELKRFHNPTAVKTRRLFLDYLQIDVCASWKWLNFDPSAAKKTLDELIAKRGDAVHRSKAVGASGPSAHLVKRDDLEKAVRFLKGLVEATEKALVDE